MSWTRPRFVSASTSWSSARRRRRSWRRTPATSSNSGRRSSGRRASAWSTMPWPMNRNALSARWAASRRSTRSRRRTAALVQQVVVLARAVEPAADLEHPVVDRQQAVGVVEDEGDVGHADRRPALRSGEDDVLALARPERPALLAERPAEGIGEVALARAVGPDDRADAAAELDDGPLGEGLEAVEPKTEQPGRGAHPRPPRVTRRPRPPARRGPARRRRSRRSGATARRPSRGRAR